MQALGHTSTLHDSLSTPWQATSTCNQTLQIPIWGMLQKSHTLLARSEHSEPSSKPCCNQCVVSPSSDLSILPNPPVTCPITTCDSAIQLNVTNQMPDTTQMWPHTNMLLRACSLVQTSTWIAGSLTNMTTQDPRSQTSSYDSGAAMGTVSQPDGRCHRDDARPMASSMMSRQCDTSNSDLTIPAADLIPVTLAASAAREITRQCRHSITMVQTNTSTVKCNRSPSSSAPRMLHQKVIEHRSQSLTVAPCGWHFSSSVNKDVVGHHRDDVLLRVVTPHPSWPAR